MGWLRARRGEVFSGSARFLETNFLRFRDFFANQVELTGNLGDALEGTSIGDCRLFRPLAENLVALHFVTFATLSVQSRTQSSRPYAIANEAAGPPASISQ